MARRLSGRAAPVLVLSHAPPRGVGDCDSDPYHVGYAGYRWLLERVRPPLWLHGHTTPASVADWRDRLGRSVVANVTGSVIVELLPPALRQRIKARRQAMTEPNAPGSMHAVDHRSARLDDAHLGRPHHGSVRGVRGGSGTPSGPPPHLHRGRDEAFHVLEGRYVFVREHEEVTLGPGDSIFVPRGTRHGFRTLEPASKTLIIVAPAGLEAFFREMGVRLAAGLSPLEAMTVLADTFDSIPVE